METVVNDHQLILRELFQLSPSRAAARRYIDDLRTKSVVPSYGTPVGSNGPDFSFRLSRIWHSEGGTTGPRLFPTRHIVQNILHPFRLRANVNGFEVNPRMSYADHHHLDVIATSDLGVQRWTRYARHIGLCHDGKWGHLFPPKRVWNTQPNFFGLLNIMSSVSLNHRSENAAKRRKERRALRKKLSPISFREEPFEVRLQTSQKSYRKIWIDLVKQGKNISFTEFKKTHPNKKILVPASAKRYRCEMPRIVLEALEKIYSRKTYYIKRKDSAPPVLIRSEPTPVGMSLEERLLAIEEGGFCNRYEWYNIYHLIQKDKGL